MQGVRKKLFFCGLCIMFIGCGETSATDLATLCQPIIIQQPVMGSAVPAGSQARMFRADMAFPLGCVPPEPETTHLLLRGWMSLEGTVLESVSNRWDIWVTPAIVSDDVLPNAQPFPLLCDSVTSCNEPHFWFQLYVLNTEIPSNSRPFSLFVRNAKDPGGTLRLHIEWRDFALWNTRNENSLEKWIPIPRRELTSEWFDFATDCHTQC